MLRNKVGYNAYRKAWRERRQEAIQKIPCGCGTCGLMIPAVTQDGQPARFAKGHNNRGQKTGQPSWNRIGDQPLTSYERVRRSLKKRRANSGTKLCACGCRTDIQRLTAQGRPAQYAVGHAPGGAETRFRKGQKPWNIGIPCPSSRTANLGRKRSLATRARISAASKGRPAWNKGRPHVMQQQGNRTSYAHGGVRPDLGQYFRSRWEANYARYLRWIGCFYVYESACFIVTLPDGSAHAYRPDFLVDDREFVELRGRYPFQDVAAHKDAILIAAAAQLPHPLHVIRKDEYSALDDTWKFVIQHWEYGRSRFDADRSSPCPTCGDPMRDKPQKQTYCSCKCRPNQPFAGRTHSHQSIQKGIATRRANNGGKY